MIKILRCRTGKTDGHLYVTLANDLGLVGNFVLDCDFRAMPWSELVETVFPLMARRAGLDRPPVNYDDDDAWND